MSQTLDRQGVEKGFGEIEFEAALESHDLSLYLSARHSCYGGCEMVYVRSC